MEKPKRHLITSALPYANGPLHIGHIAGAFLTGDTYVRYLKMKGEDVVYICGSDEHGAAITLRAKKEGSTPQDIVDKYHSINKKAFEDFGIDFDIYHRTSTKLHHETAQDFFKVLYEKGTFTEEVREQYYDEEHQQFLADRYITGTCPNCDYDKAYGDQCEHCGKSLSPRDLTNPVSTLSGKAPVLKTTGHWYLPMQNHSDWLREWISNGVLDGVQHHDASKWKKNVVGQCLSWIDAGDGLQPRAMTRDLDWGVKVPLESAEGKVLYVWLDAPIGYISATKQWGKEEGRSWEDYWKNDQTKLVHFIGKDNIVFHCIIFPILLREHGSFVLPENVPANEFLNLEGEKISTSRNHAVWLHEYLEDLPGRQDELRYVLTSIAPESKDSEFTWKDYQARVNNELVAILGNFVNRALVLTHKYFDGKVPALSGQDNFGEEIEGKSIYDYIAQTYATTEKHLEAYEFRAALGEMMNLARLGNKYFTDYEPWHLFKTEPGKTANVMHHALQISAHLSILMRPFLPNAADRLASMLGIENASLPWKVEGPVLVDGNPLQEPELLFQKVEDAEIENQINKLVKNKTADRAKASGAKPQKDMISFDDFTKLDIRVGEILEAEKVEGADKLLKLKVDTGLDQRIVVSGIAEHYKPEDIIGKKVSVLLNLAPRKIRGVESQGMILMAENEAGVLSFVSPGEGIGPGATIR